MNKDLVAINEEIEELLKKQPTMEKYQRLGVLFVCKHYIEKTIKPTEGTIIEVLESKSEQIGANSTLKKLEPILAQHIKDLEMIAPTISGVLVKKLKEM